MLYKMDLLIMERSLWSVVNIRLKLADFELRKSQRKCKRRVESNFRVVVQPARLDFRREALYQQHKTRFKGFVHNTLGDYLHAGFNRTVFNTMEVGVYDGSKLIAVSFFDLGEQAMASLLALYDEHYAPFSLGRYTMLKEIDFGIAQGYKWYYPGYVLDRPSLFDYKTEVGTLQYYTPNRRWGAYANYRSENSPALELMNQTARLTAALSGACIPYVERFYPFFSMAYLGIWSHAFLPLPLVIELGIDTEGMLAMGCDPVSHRLVMGYMHPCPNEHQFLNREHAEEYNDPAAYLTHLMEFTPINERFDAPEDAVDYLLQWRLNRALYSPIQTP